MSITDETLRLRNAVKESAYKRLVTAFVAHAGVQSKASASDAEREQADAELQQALEAQQLVLAKQATLCGTYSRDAAAASARQAELEEETRETQLAIRALVARLEDERVVRNNKEEYAALAKLILTLPPRADVAAHVRELEAQRDALVAHGRALEQRRLLRERQFSVLLHAVADLQAQLDEETAATAATAASAAGGVAEDAVGATATATAASASAMQED